MTTWHQRQPARRGEPVDLRHPTKWRVIEDPPNAMMVSVGEFDTKAEADRCAMRGKHRYVLPPKSKGDLDSVS